MQMNKKNLSHQVLTTGIQEYTVCVYKNPAYHIVALFIFFLLDSRFQRKNGGKYKRMAKVSFRIGKEQEYSKTDCSLGFFWPVCSPSRFARTLNKRRGLTVLT